MQIFILTSENHKLTIRKCEYEDLKLKMQFML